MKHIIAKTLIVLGLAKFGISDGECQGFGNLGFESAAIVSSGMPFMVDYSSAFPDWTVSVGGNSPTYAWYDTYALNTSGICIIDIQSQHALNDSLMDGNYTAILEAGQVGGNSSLSQTGVVPDGTLSLQFKAWSYGGPFIVSLGGQALSLQTLGTGANYTLYGADISSWAGKSAQLQFGVSVPGGYTPNFLYLDAIDFSPIAVVPEPETYALCLFGIAGFWAYRRLFRAA